MESSQSPKPGEVSETNYPKDPIDVTAEEPQNCDRMLESIDAVESTGIAGLIEDEDSHGSMNLVIDEKVEEQNTSSAEDKDMENVEPNTTEASQATITDERNLCADISRISIITQAESNNVAKVDVFANTTFANTKFVNVLDTIQNVIEIDDETDETEKMPERMETDSPSEEKRNNVIEIDDEEKKAVTPEKTADSLVECGVLHDTDENKALQETPIDNMDVSNVNSNDLEHNKYCKNNENIDTSNNGKVLTEQKDKCENMELLTDSEDNLRLLKESSSSKLLQPNSKTDELLNTEVFFDKECINYDCSNDTKKFYRAPQFVLSYYNIPKKRGKIQFICERCYDETCLIYEEYGGLLQNKLPMYLKSPSLCKQEFVEIDSSDEEVDSNSTDKEHFSEDMLHMIENELENSIKKVFNDVDIQNQLTWSKTILSARLDSLEKDTELFSSELSALQEKSDKMHSSLYRWSKSRIQGERPLDLNTGRIYVLKGADLPPVGEAIRAPIKINEAYFAVKNKPIASWVPCKVIEQVDSSQNNVPLYKVKFLRSPYQLLKTVSAKHLAYYDPPNVRLAIGARVIAYFDVTSLTRGKEKINIQSAYYPGIIAEPLKYANNFRYLVFYDDGYTQYVSPKDVRLVCQASENVWEDIHFGSRDFIQKYLTEYLINRPMVQTLRGQTILTETNGKWLNARVLEVDCSLILLQFEGTRNHTEWIYRGSMRLGPVYRENQQKNSLPVARTPRRTETFISYSVDDENTPRQRKEATAPVRAVAKKSVSRPSQQSSAVSAQSTSSLHAPVCLNSSTIYVDDEVKPRGKVVFYTAVRSNTPSIYKPHKCFQKCVYNVPHNLNLYSPLAKPLLSGWERLIFKQRAKKVIAYRAPCGRILRNMENLHRYLRETENVLNVDNFDFSPDINCLAEYVIENAIIRRRDISCGKEKMPIPLVNYYDRTMPPDCQYSAQRIPTEGVNLNLNEEFLVGCDCEDDCSDRSKCSCWQLTLEGAKYGNPNTPIEEVGYQYKRLLEHVPTGVYECNPRCKCKSNCLNRVVQNFLQTKLQVFKTSNRGWGLRCLNDIPKGSFVCIYAGYLLTEAKANEGGKEIGDEYFAELDYIETAEQVKEGYESDVETTEPEDDDDDDDDTINNDKDYDDDDFTPSKTYVSRAKKTPRLTRSSTTQSEEDSQERQVINFNPKADMGEDTQRESSMRKLFGKDEHCYVMDAKITGNLGRYFNHSCAPNLFVQNVFVDTHDLRFPWVAFFAASNIRAGTELTWNYNYEVGVVPGKVLYCQCGAPNCRVRLL